MKIIKSWTCTLFCIGVFLGNKELSVETFIQKMNERAATIPDADIIFFGPPSIPGFGNSAGFSMVLLDRADNDIEEVDTG